MLLDVALALCLFIAACVSYFSEIDESQFHPDESRWLNRAHYIADVLDPFGPTWNDQYLTRGQPPIGSYVMGLGLLAQGRDLDTNRAFDFRRSFEFNRANGMLPERADLEAGRRTNAFLGALTVLVVYVVGRRLTNPVGGIAGAVLLIAHPLVIWHNSLALADTTLLLTLALLLYAACRLADRPSWGWAVTLGVLVGIGGANKLTPLALLAPLILIGIILLGRDWFARLGVRRATGSEVGRLPSPGHPGWMLLATPIIAGITFVAVYPYLWQQPIWRTLRLIEFRRQENDGQAVLFPRFQVDGPLDAMDRTWIKLGSQWSSTEQLLLWAKLDPIAGPLSTLDLWLALLGLVALVAFAIRTGIQSRATLVLALTVTQTATILLSMRADFERYYLPIVLGSTIYAGFIVGFGASRVAGLVGRLRRVRARSSSALAGSPGSPASPSAQPR
ncbi:MAG: glycosyltransferase family 39 protein [Chloroflexia bacterium]|nr:glycosyltransferase family 39 protein [Chloroflexia bacterium]